jgi:PAS domain S-box-containing protein
MPNVSSNMVSDELEQQAALYVLGLLPQEEEITFAEQVQRDENLQQLVRDLEETTARILIADSPARQPRMELKQQILQRAGVSGSRHEAEALLHVRTAEAMVIADEHGRVEWFNQEFTSMCGYSVEELRGKKPGAVLQGKATDPAAVANLREAILQARPCIQEIVNYHKNGEPYWVAISLVPILDPSGKPRCFLALEQRLDRPVQTAV